ncbi:MAG: GNAT family N-acetyltransferase [Candidatus Pseudobacter hemicellulosilyticus]|uniref:GNAT family N-acetyltransferase n=1 Tax=Candidatus Pseudobacter hemicellulosilyticus TaxID=3121375 RepID=A0AAJ5WUB8_9BACT|nr:MAG: GNAT family N-acetyltransferase [Pseudobacter sp.]
MNFQQIRTADHPQLAFVQALYETSFPWQERRAWQQVLQLLPEPAMQLWLVQEEERPVAFLICWQLEHWCYLEHFAVDPLERGKQYGAAIMDQLISRSEGKLLLEVERPHDPDSQRRIRFYERLGFRLLDIDYYQPAYRTGEPTVPMLLLSYSFIEDPHAVIHLADLLSTTVYQRYYDKLNG